MDKFLLFINTAMLTMFVENAIFSRALGTSVAFYASRKKESIIGLGLGITYVTVLSSFVTFWFDAWLYDFEYYYVIMPLIYTLIAAVIYTASLLVIWRFLPRLFRTSSHAMEVCRLLPEQTSGFSGTVPGYAGKMYGMSGTGPR